jgi:hypothetical protein
VKNGCTNSYLDACGDCHDGHYDADGASDDGFDNCSAG